MKKLVLTLLLISAAMQIVADNPPTPTPPPLPETIPIKDDGSDKGKERSITVWLPHAIYDAGANEVIFSCIIDDGETWLVDSFGQIVGYYAGLNGEISTIGLPAGQYTIVFVLDGAQAFGQFQIK